MEERRITQYYYGGHDDLPTLGRRQWLIEQSLFRPWPRSVDWYSELAFRFRPWGYSTPFWVDPSPQWSGVTWP